MPMTATQVQQLYVAYFNRPADYLGLQYWMTQDASAASKAFAASAEYAATYAGMNTGARVDAIYQNLFGHSADLPGLTYWSNLVESGKLTISDVVVAVSNGAQGTDKAAYDAKVSASSAFTTALDTTAEVTGYSGTAANNAAKAWLAGINSAAQATTATTTAALNATVASVVAVGGAAGSTYTLTTGFDSGAGFVGGAGNDRFVAGVAVNPASGLAEIETLTVIDEIDGGAGTDTLEYTTVGATALPAATIKNIEIISMISDGAATADVSAISSVTTLNVRATGGAVDIDTKANVSSVTVTGTATTVAIDDAGTAATSADKIASVSITGNTGNVTIGATNAVDSLTSLSLTDTKDGDATVTATAGTRALSISLNNVTGPANNVVITDDLATSVAISARGAASSAIDLQTDVATTITIDADEKLTFAAIDASKATTITVTGDSLVTFTTNTAADLGALTTVTSAGSTGGLSMKTELATGVQFTGGAGKDAALFGATTKAQVLGAGDDTATISADLGTGGSIDAGDGSDTLTMTATLAATLDDNTTFNGKVSNFEKLSLTAATTQTLNLSNLDGLNYVIEAGNGNTLTLDNIASGGTLEFTDASTNTAVVVKDAATGTADVFNVKITNTATMAAGTLTVANVETININSDDKNDLPAKDGSVKHTLTLTADKATSVVVTGDAALNLTLTGSTKITSINASAIEGGFQTNLSVASGITLTGSAKADTVTLGQLSVVTGGAGTDVYTITTPTSTGTYATITDFAVKETIQFTDKGDNLNGAALGAKIALASTASFSDYLDAAAAGDGSTDGIEKWFQYNGDTYVVHDISSSAGFVNGADELVKLTGILDLSKSTVSAGGLFTFVAA